jgi:hypothetical protein
LASAGTPPPAAVAIPAMKLSVVASSVAIAVK